MSSEKVLIFDSGPLINLSMNGLLYILEELKKKFDGKFIITDSVKYEVVDRPVGIHRFELGALRVEHLLDSGILELPSSLGISESDLKKETQRFMEEINHKAKFMGNWINLVSEAEMSCLALSKKLTEKGIKNIIAIDERTTRILCENPESLEKIMEEKLHHNIDMVSKDFAEFENFAFIRSSEIVYVAYKKGLVDIEGKKVLEALLYATKFHGSSISFEEIEELSKL